MRSKAGHRGRILVGHHFGPLGVTISTAILLRFDEVVE